MNNKETFFLAVQNRQIYLKDISLFIAKNKNLKKISQNFTPQDKWSVNELEIIFANIRV
jgi:hypothetical protein